MIKKLFDTVKLNTRVTIQKQAMQLIVKDIDLLFDLIDHPVKKRNTIKALLTDMKTVITKALQE
jgi:hypothetical protein